jgi:hypothetical protein
MHPKAPVMSRLFSLSVIAVFVVAGSAVLLVAQSRMSTITGLISDPQRLPVPGAAVSVTNEATGVTIQTQANNAGMYRVENLIPGSYRVGVSSPGFKTVVRTGLTLETGQIGRFDAALAVGDVKQTVSVIGSPALLQTESSEVVSQTVAPRELEYIPNVDRKYPTLLGLSALTTGTGEQTFGHAYPTIGGSVGNNTGFYLNGAQATDPAGVGFLYSFSAEFVGEFKVIPNSASAQYEGDKVIQVVTKSGANEFHGQGNFFIQDAAFNANQWGAPKKLPFRDDELGFQLGGPIKKNKTFFFGGYQRARFNQNLPAFLTVPTQLQKQGDFSKTFDATGDLIKIYDPATTRPDPNNPGSSIRDQFPGNVIPQGQIDPVAAKILSFFPDPNQAGTITGGLNYLATRNTTHTTPMYNFRLDQQWNNQDRTFASFNRHDFGAAYPSIFGIQGFNDFDGQANSEQFQMLQITATNTYVPSPQWVLDTSFAWMAFSQEYRDAGYNKGFPETLGLTGLPAVSPFPILSLAGYSMVGGGLFGDIKQHPFQNYSISQDVTNIRGKHSVKFGFTFHRFYQQFLYSLFISSLNFGTQPTALPNLGNTGNAAAALLLGFPMSAGRQNERNIVGRGLTYEAYVQDDWKVLPNLTLNAGIRWEALAPPVTVRDDQGNPFVSSFDPKCINPVSGTPGCVTYAGKDFPANHLRSGFRYFAPRGGLSWLPWGAGSKTVVRAGGGIYWIALEGGATASSQSGFNVVYPGNFSSPDNGITAPFLLKDGFPPIPALSVEGHGFGAVPVGQQPRVDVTYQDRNAYQRPYAIQYNFTIQHRLVANTELQMAYQAYLGRHNWNTIQNNQLTPSQFGPGNAQIRRPFPQYGNVTNFEDTVFTSSYNALFVEAKRRYSQGLNFDVQYVFDKNLSNDGPWNRYDFKSATRIIEPQHRLVGYAIYDLPWGPGRKWLTAGVLSKVVGGWVASPVLKWQSGSYLDVTYNTDTTNGFLQGNQGVNLIGRPNLPGGQRTMARWFNTAAFAPPAPYTLGNAGRTIVEGPRSVLFDMGISRIDKINERISTQVGVNLFNAFNHSNLSGPNTTLGSPTFGIISSKSGNRSLQLLLRVFF